MNGYILKPAKSPFTAKQLDRLARCPEYVEAQRKQVEAQAKAETYEAEPHRLERGLTVSPDVARAMNDSVIRLEDLRKAGKAPDEY